MRKGKVYYGGMFAGIITEDENAFSFLYDKEYLKSNKARPVSLTMPLKKEPYISSIIFPFFDGINPDGWLLDIAESNWKIDRRDRMGLLLTFCKDCIGAVSIIPVEE